MEKNPNDQTATARRKFLGWTAGGIAVVAGVGALGWKLSTPTAQNPAIAIAHALPPLPPPLPTHEAFAGQMHSKFSMSAAGPAADLLELNEISDVNIQKVGNRELKTFSLMFTGPAATRHEQNIYTVHHDKLGTMDLFLVPIGKPKGDVVRYESVLTIFS